jgi:hypothetical protein
MIGTFLFSLALFGLSGFLLDWHRRSWRLVPADSSLTTNERRYALSQYRRRTQASAIIGVLGVAVGLAPVVPHRPWPMAIYLASLSGACLAIVVLAAIDAWSTRQYYTRLRDQNLAEQVKLVGDLRERSGNRSRNTDAVLEEIAE